ncbi:alpha-L-rhamnosidase [Novosphingobium aquae]|uniref:alpha-L-rhamnosidase n=1 Tax=Novosphingobium aquae TaxID=3133435 RepID=A0ABU8S4H3_9SPHN
MGKLHLSRRAFIVTTSAAPLLSSKSVLAANLTKLKVFGLRVAQVETPLGVESSQPSLGWRFEAGDGISAAAYRIRVASSEQALRSGVADLWDSQWVESRNAITAVYEGAALSSRQRCFWMVSVRDQHGATATSQSSFWEMGLLNPKDWDLSWLACEDAVERGDREAGAAWVNGSAGVGKPRLFRLGFSSEKANGLITLSVDGTLHRLSLDGRDLPLPSWDRNAFGAPPALRLESPLEAGDHVLEAEISATPGYFTKPNVAVAAQVRVTEGGQHRRISGGWTTLLAEDLATRKAAVAEVMDPQPLFPWPAAPARLLRREFRLEARPQGARLYAAALGAYEIWINGAPVSDAALEVSPSDFAHHVPYRVYDVGGFLRPGVNVISARVADGFYASYLAPVGRYPFGPAPRRLLVQLEATSPAGTTIVSGAKDWRGAAGSLRYSEVYGGEDWDYSQDQAGWQAVGFDDSAWEPAHLASGPAVPLVSSITPPIEVTRELSVQALRQVGPDRYVADFGQNFAGRVRLRLPRVHARTITVRHSELIDAKGELDRRNLRAARAEDSYRFDKATDRVVLEPRYSYQGFRYAEISGVTGLAANQVAGLVMTSGIEETGTFAVDQPVVQKVWLNTMWSQRSNFLGIPTDCPQRDERLGWAGDAQIFWDTAAFNMDVGSFTREWLREFRAAQGPAGNYPLWAPMPATAGFGPPQSTPGWADAGVMLPYISYVRYGDRAIVDENWRAMRKYVDGILKANPDGLWAHNRGVDFGDWLAVDAKQPGDETTPKGLVATAMLARSLAQLADLARWTGRESEAGELRLATERVREAFAGAFVREDGSVGNGSQTSYILGLSMDLVPRSLRALAADKLVADIQRRGTALSTGFLGTPLALDVLADTGHRDTAVDLLLRTDFPSWGHMVRAGATTMWERWNGDSGDPAMNSYNHYAFGAVCGFLYRRVAGIVPIEPGFARMRIAPLFDRRLGRIRARYESVRGAIAVDIRPTHGGAELDVQVPSGASADLCLPVGATGTAGGKALGDGAECPGGEGRLHLLRSGRHLIRLTGV